MHDPGAQSSHRWLYVSHFYRNFFIKTYVYITRLIHLYITIYNTYKYIYFHRRQFQLLYELSPRFGIATHYFRPFRNVPLWETGKNRTHLSSSDDEFGKWLKMPEQKMPPRFCPIINRMRDGKISKSEANPRYFPPTFRRFDSHIVSRDGLPHSYLERSRISSGIGIWTEPRRPNSIYVYIYISSCLSGDSLISARWPHQPGDFRLLGRSHDPRQGCSRMRKVARRRRPPRS